MRNDLERLVGHWTFAALVCRPLLSCLRAVYDFLGDEVSGYRVFRRGCCERFWPCEG